MSRPNSNELTLEPMSRMMRDRGVERLFYKSLAPNDNSKNQIYLGGEISVLNVIPSGELIEEESESKKPGAKKAQRLKAKVPLSWLDAEGSVYPAPSTQLILYPQYPEVRLSGFLQGSSTNLGEWFNPQKKGRTLGRVLLLGVARNGHVYAHLAPPQSALSRQIPLETSLGTFGALTELQFGEDDGTQKLLSELCRIHRLGWMTGRRLDASGDNHPCNSPNCGGYTLEAELGITPNGFSEPDFLGWEVKTFTVANFSRIESRVTTLMTPEPDGGVYKEDGVEEFVRRFGYPDEMGRRDRLNFGGVHVAGVPHPKTGLRLTLIGYDEQSGKIQDVNAGIALMYRDTCAAIWTYRKLINHWRKKHDRAVFIPNQGESGPPRRYRYGSEALFGRGTDFELLLKAFSAGRVYYDPGIKLENASGPHCKVKRRNQFRIKAGQLESLYKEFNRQLVCAQSGPH
ncbi:MAG: MvaI/BcnI family restriction endonuclease [Burkholderiales bacterium]